ncbi:DUF4349 domain-containing protein [Oceanobacillus bengalensis]|nr:DUF4349 domain-containing protein [Oceanobacillus bengalensis]
MKKYVCYLFIVFVGMFLAACSNDQSMESSDLAEVEMATEDAAVEREMNSFSSEDRAEKSEEAETLPDEGETDEVAPQEADRKIIYTAHLNIEVKDFDKSFTDIQTKAADFGGYVVESNMYGGADDNPRSGQITARIPQGSFQDFIQLVEDGSSDVIESSVSGQDVTEEFVDLESRLKSKRVVEERLLSFMEQAEKTEDLLAISGDLSKVQGEIEEILGRMNYLQNKADLATVTIFMQENDLKLTGINEDELNTWEKTKQQFLKSINFLIAAFSSLFVFLIGNLPIFIPLIIVGVIVFFFIRKKRRGEKQS